MPIIGKLDEDRSDVVCKIYAEQALELLNKGPGAASPAAGVPLANLFRLFEMYRYDAFEDERRSGVLAIADGDGTPPNQPEPWYKRIKGALDKAASTVFGKSPKEEIVDELQVMLRKLASSEVNAATPGLEKHKAFYKEFSSALPA